MGAFDQTDDSEETIPMAVQGSQNPYQPQIDAVQAQRLALMPRRSKLMEQLEAPDHLSLGEGIGRALIAAIPTALGAAFAGNRGGAAGANAGLAGLSYMDKQQEEERAVRQKLGFQQLADMNKEDDLLAQNINTLRTGGLARAGKEADRKQDILRHSPGGDLYQERMAGIAAQGRNQIDAAKYRADMGGVNQPIPNTVLAAYLNKLPQPKTPDEKIAYDANVDALSSAANNPAQFQKLVQILIPSASADIQDKSLDFRRQKFDASYGSGAVVPRKDIGPVDPEAKPKAESSAIAYRQIKSLTDELIDSMDKNGGKFTGQESAFQSARMNDLIDAIRRQRGQGANFTNLERELNIAGMGIASDNIENVSKVAIQALRGIAQSGKLKDFALRANREAMGIINGSGYDLRPGFLDYDRIASPSEGGQSSSIPSTFSEDEIARKMAEIAARNSSSSAGAQ